MVKAHAELVDAIREGVAPYQRTTGKAGPLIEETINEVTRRLPARGCNLVILRADATIHQGNDQSQPLYTVTEPSTGRRTIPISRERRVTGPGCKRPTLPERWQEPAATIAQERLARLKYPENEDAVRTWRRREMHLEMVLDEALAWNRKSKTIANRYTEKYEELAAAGPWPLRVVVEGGSADGPGKIEAIIDLQRHMAGRYDGEMMKLHDDLSLAATANAHLMLYSTAREESGAAKNATAGEMARRRLNAYHRPPNERAGDLEWAKAEIAAEWAAMEFVTAAGGVWRPPPGAGDAARREHHAIAMAPAAALLRLGRDLERADVAARTGERAAARRAPEYEWTPALINVSVGNGAPNHYRSAAAAGRDDEGATR